MKTQKQFRDGKSGRKTKTCGRHHKLTLTKNQEGAVQQKRTYAAAKEDRLDSV